MSGISDYIEQIRSATYGEEVRGSIVSALEQCYADATGNPESVAALTEKVNNLVAQGYVTSAELEEAIAGVQTDGINRQTGTLVVSSNSFYQKPSRVTITAPNIINNPTGVTGAILSVAEGFSAGDSVTISADILSASEVTEACFYVMVYDDTFDVGSRLYGETLSGATTSEFSRLNWTIKIDERYTTAKYIYLALRSPTVDKQFKNIKVERGPVCTPYTPNYTDLNYTAGNGITISNTRRTISANIPNASASTSGLLTPTLYTALTDIWSASTSGLLTPTLYTALTDIWDFIDTNHNVDVMSDTYNDLNIVLSETMPYQLKDAVTFETTMTTASASRVRKTISADTLDSYLVGGTTYEIVARVVNPAPAYASLQPCIYTSLARWTSGTSSSLILTLTINTSDSKSFNVDLTFIPINSGNVVNI